MASGDDAVVDDRRERLDRGDRLLGRAERLDRHLRIDAAAAEARGQRFDLGVDPVRVLEPRAVEQRRVAADAVLRGLRRANPVRDRHRQDHRASRQRAVETPGASGRQHQGERERVRGLLFAEMQHACRDRGRSQRRGEIGRPQPAIEDARAVDGDAEPGHQFGADPDRAGDGVGIVAVIFASEHQRRRNGYRGRRCARAGMDVVDLGMPDDGGQHAGGVGGRRAQHHLAQRPALRGLCAGHRGDQRIGHMPAQHGAFGLRQRGGRGAHDEGGKLPDDAHERSGCLTARRHKTDD